MTVQLKGTGPSKKNLKLILGLSLGLSLGVLLIIIITCVFLKYYKNLKKEFMKLEEERSENEIKKDRFERL